MLSTPPPHRPFSSSIIIIVTHLHSLSAKRNPSILSLSFPFTHPSYASRIYTSILFIYFMEMFLKSLCVQFLMSFFQCIFCQLTYNHKKVTVEKVEKSEKTPMFLCQIFLIKSEKNNNKKEQLKYARLTAFPLSDIYLF